MNRVIHLFDRAKEQHWCTRFYCTTCRAQDFTEAVQEYIHADLAKFVEDLKSCDFKELDSRGDWIEGLQIIFSFSEIALGRHNILNHWIEREDIGDRHYDYIFFYLLRYTPDENLLDAWVSKLIKRATLARNVSIVESLLIVLEKRFLNHPDLVHLISNKYLEDRKIKRLFNRYTNNWV